MFSGKSIRNTTQSDEENRSEVLTNPSMTDNAHACFEPKLKPSTSPSEDKSFPGWLRLSAGFFDSKGSIEQGKKSQIIEIELLRGRLRKVDASLVESMDVNQETQAKLIQQTICESRKHRETQCRFQLYDQAAQSPSDKHSHDKIENSLKEPQSSNCLTSQLDLSMDFASKHTLKGMVQLVTEDASSTTPVFRDSTAPIEVSTISQRCGIQVEQVLTNKAYADEARTPLDDRIPSNNSVTCACYPDEDDELPICDSVSSSSEGSTPDTTIQSNNLQKEASVSKSKTSKRKLQELDWKTAESKEAEKRLLMDLVELALADSHDLHLIVEVPEDELGRNSDLTKSSIDECAAYEIVDSREDAYEQTRNAEYGRNYQDITAQVGCHASTEENNQNILSAVGAWLSGSTPNEKSSYTYNKTTLENSPTRAVGGALDISDAKPKKCSSEGASPIKTVLDAVSGWLAIPPQDHGRHHEAELDSREKILDEQYFQSKPCQQGTDLQEKFQTLDQGHQQALSGLPLSHNDSQDHLSISSSHEYTESFDGSRDAKRARLLTRAQRKRSQDAVTVSTERQ